MASYDDDDLELSEVTVETPAGPVATRVMRRESGLPTTPHAIAMLALSVGMAFGAYMAVGWAKGKSGK